MVRIAGGLGSVARVLLVLGAGAAGGAALSTHLGAQAEDASAAAIAALTARVDALEKQADEPIKAPFEVVGEGGQTIFSVAEESGGSVLELGTQSSGLITLNTTGDELEVSLAKGDNTISLSASGDGATLNVAGAGGAFEVKGAGEAPTLTMSDGSEAFLKVDTAQGGPQLTLQKSSQMVRIVAIPEQTGVLADANGTHFQMGSIESIKGFVVSKGDLPLAGLGTDSGDKYRVVIYNGGDKPVFSGGYDRNTGKLGLFVSDDSGQNIASIAAGEGSGAGELKLMQPGGQPLVTLGPSDGGDGGKLKLGAGDDGLTATTRGGTATVIAKVGGKIAEMGVTSKSTGFVVGGDEKPLAALADNGDNKPFLAIYGAGGGQPVATLGTTSGQPALRVFDKSGGLAMVAGVVEAGRGAVKVYESNRIMAGMEADGGGNSSVYVTIDENDVAGLYNRDGKGEIRVNNSSQSQVVKLGMIGNQGTITLSDGTNPTVTLGPTEKNDNTGVRVFNKGNMVFAAGSTNSGDGAAIVLSGGKLAAGMEASGSNGKVYVLANDNEVASINSTDKAGQGLVVVRNSGGTAVAMLQYGGSGGGNVTTTNPGGQGVFSAGYASDGAGEACVYRKTQAGTGRMACVGLGLPSAGMGK